MDSAVFSSNPKVSVDTFVQWFEPLVSVLITTTTNSKIASVEGVRMTQLAHKTESRVSPIKKPGNKSGSFKTDRTQGTPTRQSGITAKSQLLLDPRLKDEAETRETELVKSAQAGSTDAFAALQKFHWSRLHRRVFSIIKNREDTEDVLQDTFLRAYVALRTFEGRSKFSSWLTRIAMNSAFMNIRKRRASSQVLVEQLSESDDVSSLDILDSRLNPEQIYDQHQRCTGMLRILERLDPILQAPLQIRTSQECSIKEIARALNISQAAAKTRLHRARRHIRQSLALENARDHLSPKLEKEAGPFRPKNF